MNMAYVALCFLVATSVIQQVPSSPAQSRTQNVGQSAATGTDRARLFEPPILLKKIEPTFSREAVLIEFQGTVLLSVLVGEDGTVQRARIARSPGLGLDEKAVEAVRSWRFQPARMNGGAVAASVTVAVDFRFRSNEPFWHSIGQHFGPSEGASRPVVVRAAYPPYGPSEDANLTVSFDVDQNGVLQNIHVVSSSAPAFDSEMTKFLRVWRFRPGVKEGVPVTIGCTLNLVWSSGRIRSYRSNLLLDDAALAGDTDAVVTLLMDGANPKLLGNRGYSPLHEAALKGNAGLVKILLEYGADVNGRSKDGRLPLHDAAVAGNAETVMALIASGADVTAQTKDEAQTALHIAAAWGRIDVIKVLLTAKAPTSIRDVAGRTPLEEAAINEQHDAVAVLQQSAH